MDRNNDRERGSRRGRSRSRSRSRSPSNDNDRRRPPPPRDGFRDRRGDNRDTREPDRERLERERRERMARLRAENDAEERNVGGPLDGDSISAGDGAQASLSEHNNKSKPKKLKNTSDNENSDDDEDGLDEMQQMLGFGGFGSTKGKAVADNQSSAAKGAASKNKGRKYRQYMNRKGGFNRPLDKMV